jgi:hypothetical protein
MGDPFQGHEHLAELIGALNEHQNNLVTLAKAA